MQPFYYCNNVMINYYFGPNIRVIFRRKFATIIAYLRHAIPSFKIATPHSQYLRHNLCGANHNRASPRHCSFRSPFPAATTSTVWQRHCSLRSPRWQRVTSLTLACIVAWGRVERAACPRYAIVVSPGLVTLEMLPTRGNETPHTCSVS